MSLEVLEFFSAFFRTEIMNLTVDYFFDGFIFREVGITNLVFNHHLFWR